jgi:hypothetical protein
LFAEDAHLGVTAGISRPSISISHFLFKMKAPYLEGEIYPTLPTAVKIRESNGYLQFKAFPSPDDSVLLVAFIVTRPPFL